MNARIPTRRIPSLRSAAALAAFLAFAPTAPAAQWTFDLTPSETAAAPTAEPDAAAADPALVSRSVSALAAATAGLARYTSLSTWPMRPTKLRLVVEIARSPAARMPK